MSKSIYPSIPSPGKDPESMRACLDAIRQTMTMIIINAQNPSPNYTPSSAAQIFVTNAQLAAKTASKSKSGASTAATTTAQLKARVPITHLPPPPVPTPPQAVPHFTHLPVQALDDDEARDRGVPAGGVYRNGSQLMVRVT